MGEGSVVIKRLRNKNTEEELRRIYQRPHEHSNWPDHVIRVNKTIEIAKSLSGISSAADLSAGDAKIITSIGVINMYIGDYAGGYPISGSIDDTIGLIPKVDLFICCETLEHLDNPLQTLKKIREKTTYLLISTPHARFDDQNMEHYWAWDEDGLGELLAESGFSTTLHREVLKLQDEYYYDYQIWLCS